MGNSLSNFFKSLFSQKEIYKLLIIGLDAAGKSTILYRLKLGQVVMTQPTIGWNVESMTFNNLDFCVFDVGGQDKLRSYWNFYYATCHAVIFVVDSSDRDRVKVSADELHALLNSNDKQLNVPLLILANKQDLPNAFNISELTKELKLEGISRKWMVQATVGTEGDGIKDGFTWLSNQLKP